MDTIEANTLKHTIRAHKLADITSKGYRPVSITGVEKGMTLPSDRGDLRRQDREERNKSFDHFGAAGARLRMEEAHKESPKKPVSQPFVITKDDPSRHIHPRSKRNIVCAD